MSRPTILVVDDDAPILLLMRTILREFGFQALTATCGEEALAEARAHHPALILLDRSMPGMSGDAVLRALREDDALAAIPVLIVSGTPLDPEEIERIGATGAVLKPFDVPVLVERIRQQLNQ